MKRLMVATPFVQASVSEGILRWKQAFALNNKYRLDFLVEIFEILLCLKSRSFPAMDLHQENAVVEQSK